MRFKTLITSFILVLLGLFLNSANSKRFESVSFQKKQNIKRPSQLAAEPTLSWLTFMGSTYDDEGNGIAVDDSGNIYVVGASLATW